MTGPSYLPDHWLLNRAISVARSAHYRFTEPRKLAKARAAASALPSEPLVSIIIPTFNRRDILLSRAIPSILNQTYTNWECIIVCHGCTDHTADALEDRYGEDLRFRVFEIPRTETYPPERINHWYAGPVVPLNYGLGQVQGELIARIDDDDIWASNHLSVAISRLRREQAEFYSSNHVILPSGTRSIPYLVGANKVPVGGTQTWVYRSYLDFFEYNPDCWRKSWNRVNDVDLQKRMVDAGVRVTFSPMAHCMVSPRPGSNFIGSEAYLNDADIEDLYLFQ